MSAGFGFHHMMAITLVLFILLVIVIRPTFC